MSHTRPLAACTIISRNYLAQALVLARSFRASEPDGRFYLLVVDELPTEALPLDPALQIQLITPEQLGLGHRYHELCFKYDVVELSTAVKPSFLWLLMNGYGEHEVVYLDPDIWIARRLAELRGAFDAADIVLTPHILSPLPLDGLHPDDQDIMVSGAYNLGFIALRRSEQTASFLRWWAERLEDRCRIDVAHGLFTDQRWIDLVPSFFPSTHLLRDPTYNVAFWNLHERTITTDRSAFFVNRKPLAFFHFSGFDTSKRRVLSKHQDRVQVLDGTPLAALLDAYAALQEREGGRRCRSWGYGHDRFDDGTRVNGVLRRLYARLDSTTRARFGNPFQTTAREGRDSFLAWATRPRAADGNLSRFLRAVYTSRPDLPAAFPNISGPDRERFMEWARTRGPIEMSYDAALIVDAELVRLSGSGESREEAARMVRELVSRVVGINDGIIVLGDQIDVAAGKRAIGLPCLAGGRAPEDGGEAVDCVEELRERRGAAFALLPAAALSDLARYDGLREHLERTYAQVPNQREDLFALFDLRRRIDDSLTDETAHQKRRHYERVLRELRAAVRRLVPRGARVAVISRGDPELLKLGDRAAMHFPSDSSGAYAGYNPADADDAIERLQGVREGHRVEFLIVPATASWWLEHYQGFGRHLETYHRLHLDEYCMIYDLGRADAPGSETVAVHAVSA